MSKDLWDTNHDCVSDEAHTSSGNADLQKSVSVTETKDGFLSSLCKTTKSIIGKRRFRYLFSAGFMRLHISFPEYINAEAASR